MEEREVVRGFELLDEDIPGFWEQMATTWRDRGRKSATVARLDPARDQQFRNASKKMGG